MGTRGIPAHAGLTRPRENYRIAGAMAIMRTSESDWLYAKLAEIVNVANLWFRFRIDGMPESLLYAEYAKGGQFGWHTDCGEPPTGTRKISLSVQLSPPQDYTGGALEFAPPIGELADVRAAGTVIAFPAFVSHRIGPVPSGVRRALIAWAHGPVFS